MRNLRSRQGVVSRLYELPWMQSGDSVERQDLPDLRCWKVRRVRLVSLRRLRERLRAGWVELLHFVRSREKHELRQDGLRYLRCWNVFCRRAFNVRFVLGWYVQCGGGVELFDVRRRKKCERGENQLQTM